MTLINTLSYETIARRRSAARRLAVMPKPSTHPGDRRQTNLLLLNEALHLRAYEDADRTRTADPLGADEPGIEVLMAFLTEEFHKLHRRLDTLDRHAADLMFLQVSAQEVVLGQWQRFSLRIQALIIEAVAAEPYAGQCPCCTSTPVLTEEGRVIEGAEFDHYYHRGLNRPEHGWLICQACHRELTHSGYLASFERLPEFRRFQAAVLAQRWRALSRPQPPLFS